MFKQLRPIICLAALLVSGSQAFAQWEEVTTFNQVISDMKTFDGNLYFGGNFTKRAGSINTYWSCAYDGTDFIHQTNLIGGTGIRRFEVFNDELYSTGALEFFQDLGVNHWTGSTWESAGDFNNSHTGIFADGNDLYVGSDFGVVSKKTGNGAWSTLPALGASDDVYAFAKYGGNIIIVGGISYQGNSLNGVAKWDGTNWVTLGTGLAGGASSVVVYNNELYVAGGFTTAGGQPAKNIAKWNGTTWSDVGGSLTGASPNGIRDMVVYNNKLYVVGDFTQMGGVPAKYVAQWDGTQWTGIDLPGTQFANCVEVMNGNLYVGTFDFTQSHVYVRDLSQPLALKENSMADTHFTVYPNPADEAIFVEKSVEENLVFEIYDLNGRKIAANQSIQTITRLDLTGFAPGMYIVMAKNAENGNIVDSRRFVKN